MAALRSPLASAAFASVSSALYRSPQVSLDPPDADDVAIGSFAQLHGRLATVPALRPSANRRVGSLSIDMNSSKLCAYGRTAGKHANQARITRRRHAAANAECICLEKNGRVRFLRTCGIDFARGGD